MRCQACQVENEDSAGTCFECGRPLPAIVKGTVIASRYEILKPLGKGGMGMVYQAHDRLLRETVALKLLRPDVAQTPELAQRFLAEIRLARKVTHKNVCRIHEYGEDGERCFISMAFVHGVDLKHLLKDKGPFAPLEAFDIAAQAADGLQAIHDEGIIHRDLKTSNIMLDPKGVVRLMDFGLAKESGAVKGLTVSGAVVGTPEYMSPEQARGDRLSFQSDIYALGIVVFELFSGRVPFQGNTPAVTLYLHLHQPPPLDGPAAALIPEPLKPVLGMALAKDPAARHRTAKEMAHALREALAGFLATASGKAAELGAAPISSAIRDTAETEPMTPSPASQPPASATKPPTASAPPLGPPRRDLPVLYRILAENRRLRRARAAVLTAVLLAVGGAGYVVLKPAAGPEPLEESPVADAPNVPKPAPSSAARIPSDGTKRAPTPSTGAPRRASPSPSTSPLQAPPESVGPRVAPSESPEPPSPAGPFGVFELQVQPPAELYVDGKSFGRTPTGPLTLRLEPGVHTFRLVHPDYQPYQRKVMVRENDTTRVSVELALDALRK